MVKILRKVREALNSFEKTSSKNRLKNTRKKLDTGKIINNNKKLFIPF